ncbi:MAG: Oligopeptide transport ATP-binding protein OppF [Deltaproteobacteria bacterium ADurb.BinA014]|jgi:oligopeptide/dipeptide ABC transporter ATP-binding protein|nr:MAG: Oligopeptide transport ATP-binding protein OppF [Deltaproteobacteria bacterium ADurb.BinA014]HOF78235.1 ATP-binding cassette domain-containing protein [Smithellaceae bacterium]HOS09912.1 ATP-binding cassette domain-containing protein [Smithellaceae bacterium]HPD50185.1 ATP-binding cassette domain-containing protein [Smithellaceae bacterium]HPL50576.1 ATP-binding cassette domain-containing protein [Smithellaceae bacterium]
MAETLIDIKKLNKTYTISGTALSDKKRLIKAVTDVDLQILKGETLGLVGESGCGKSTLAKIITLLEKPSSGSVNFQGENIFEYKKEKLKQYRRKVQLIFQDPYSSLNARRSALSIISEPLVIHKIGDKVSRKKDALELMAKVGLSEQQANRYPHEFSGGQRQRIGIARALILQPGLIIADEPVSALDVSIQAQILNLLKSLKNDFSLTYLFVSHDLNVIRHMSDRVAVMYLGRVVELASSRDIYLRPSHPYTRLLLAAAPSSFVAGKSGMAQVKGEADAAGDRGCNFHSRCSYKKEICLEDIPVLKEIDRGIFCACHFAGEI